LISAINSGLPQGPAVTPYAYSSTNHAGVTGAFIGVIKNGVIVQEGPEYSTDTTPTGAVTTFTGSQQPAPASGVPSP
jgi:hypothetical protein